MPAASTAAVAVVTRASRRAWEPNSDSMVSHPAGSDGSPMPGVDRADFGGHRLGMTTQQRLDRLEDALTNLATIIEAEGRWSASTNPTVRVFGERFNQFAVQVAKERSARS